MLLNRLEITPEELERRAGWKLEPQGACKGDRCVQLPRTDDGLLDVLASVELPEITLPDRHGRPFSLQSLRGNKILLVAWASW
jgi:hypothetical protein